MRGGGERGMRRRGPPPHPPSSPHRSCLSICSCPRCQRTGWLGPAEVLIRLGLRAVPVEDFAKLLQEVGRAPPLLS